MELRKHFSLHLAIALALMLSMTATAQPSANSGQSLEGAWSITIDVAGGPSCASAPAVFTREGTIIADSCSLSLAVGYGAWIRTGNRQFAITFIGNVYGPEGAVVGSYRVRSSVSLDTTSNSFTGPFTTQFFNTTGALTLTTSGTVRASRIQVEPL